MSFAGKSSVLTSVFLMSEWVRNGLNPDGQSSGCQLAELSEWGGENVVPGVLHWLSTFLDKTLLQTSCKDECQNCKCSLCSFLRQVELWWFYTLDRLENPISMYLSAFIYDLGRDMKIFSWWCHLVMIFWPVCSLGTLFYIIYHDK